MMRDAARAGVAAQDGRPGEAEDLFERAASMAVVVWPKLFAFSVHAGAARILGLDHPMGREDARQAYDAYAAGGATTPLELFADYLLPPEEQAVTA